MYHLCSRHHSCGPLIVLFPPIRYVRFRYIHWNFPFHLEIYIWLHLDFPSIPWKNIVDIYSFYSFKDILFDYKNSCSPSENNDCPHDPEWKKIIYIIWKINKLMLIETYMNSWWLSFIPAKNHQIKSLNGDKSYYFMIAVHVHKLWEQELTCRSRHQRDFSCTYCYNR